MAQVHDKGASSSDGITVQDILEGGNPYSLLYVGVVGLDDALTVVGADLLQALMEVVARRIARCVRSSDKALLINQGEFVVILPDGYDVDAYRSLQERIRNTIEAEIVLRGKGTFLSVDFGYASFPEDGGNYDEVLARAKDAMRRTQRSRDRVALFQSNTNFDEEELHEVSDLEGAQTRTDALTGLPDARYFRYKASSMVAEAAGNLDGMTLVFCDIEKFKEYNLKHGYTSGDELLKYLSDALVKAFPNTLVARLNSDRFGILTTSEGLIPKLEGLHDLMSRFKISSTVELKAGICDIVDAEGSATKAQDYARLACDSIKGRYDRFWRQFDEVLASEVRRRQHIVDNLDTAINQGWIEVYYQPIIRSVTGDICALEALTRWNDPEFGILPPSEFIDVLEDAHLIHKLDLYMVRKVCEEGRAILDADKTCVNRSINLSRLDYQLCDIFALIDEIVVKSGFPKSKIHLEFTESAFTQDAEFFATIIKKFHDAGYGVWMDDFGSGYSSLNLLKDYRFDMLKIDMAFLQGLENNARTRDIVSSVVDMAKKLGIQTLAEGVETQQQYLFLKSIGCEMVQGFLFSKPALMVDLEAKVEQGALCAEVDTYASYYDTIGRVNMLSPAPFELSSERAESIEFSSGIPLAIVEREGSIVHIIVANESFLKIAKETEIISSTDEDTVSFNNRGAKLATDIMELSSRVKETGQDEFVDFYNFKELFTLHMMHLAECDNRDAFLVSLNKYDTAAEQEHVIPARTKPANLVYLPERQLTPWQQSSELDLTRTALVVVDVLGGKEGITPGLEDMAEKCVELVHAARAIDMPVIFSIDNHIKGIDQELELWGEHGVRGTESGTILAEFDVQESDFVIPKRRYNGFFETDLELTLRELGVDTLIVVGADTNICVLQTLAGAYFYGYKTVVPTDATATFLVGTQEAGLEYFARCYDTRIVTTQDLLNRMGSKSSI